MSFSVVYQICVSVSSWINEKAGQQRQLWLPERLEEQGPWLVFENTHEAIIDSATWALVQTLRGTPRRIDTLGEANPLTGLVFCADCRAKMYNQRTRGSEKKPYPSDAYECSAYQLGGQRRTAVCSNHHISATALRAAFLHLLIYEGRYNLIGEEHKEFAADKITDSDYYILTLVAIGRELNIRKQTSVRVHLAAGLPLTWVIEQKDTFKKYLLKLHSSSVDETIIDQMLRHGVASISERYLTATQSIARDYVAGIFGRLREHEHDPELMKLYIVGGGGCLIKNFGQFEADRVIINEDICATATGYDYLVHLRARKGGMV